MAQLIPFDDCSLETMTTDATAMTIALRSTRRLAECPHCHRPSQSCHSSYYRTITDLPWADYHVTIRLRVRRFRCRTVECPCAIFAERFRTVAPPYARRTMRLTHWIQRLILQASATAMVVPLAKSAVLISARTLIRLMHAVPDPPCPPPTIVGIDDWAWRKGHTYGTICVDLERRCPIDLLPDRDPHTIATWLQQHPTITTVVRDRGIAYIEAVRLGAPTAIQVADRWHLLKNLGDALESFLLTKRPILKRAAHAMTAAAYRDDGARPVPSLVGKNSPRNIANRDAWETDAATRYYTIHGMATQGVGQAAIARTLALSRVTVRRYLAMTEPPRSATIHRTRRSPFDAAKPYVIQRWNEGCRNAHQLWREVQDHGWPCCLRTVTRFLCLLRADSDLTPRTFRDAVTTQPYHAGVQQRPLSVLQAVRLLLREPSARADWETTYLTHMQQADVQVALVETHVQAFRKMLRDRRIDDFDDWLATALASGIPALRSFAKGLQQDYHAVKAGLSMEWSNGQTEAHVQRLKLIKRQMYGQAGFALLRTRVLYRGGDHQLAHPEQGASRLA